MKRFCCTMFAALILCLSPGLVSAQVGQLDLGINNFSVYSTLPESNQFRRVSVSFRIVNVGTQSAKPSTARVMFDDQPDNFIIPMLTPGSSAYVSRSFTTRAAQVAIVVQADAQDVLGEVDETNNNLQYTAKLGLDPGRWLSIGPSKIQDDKKTLGVGKVATIAVDPRTPAIVYAGGPGSGLWKSANAGTTWFPIGDSLPTVTINAVSVDPSNSSRILVVTPAGVFESRDEGSVWTQLFARDLKAIGSGGGGLLIAKTVNPTLYLSTKRGLRVSTDGGRNWPRVLRPDGKVISLQFSTTDSSHLFASVAGSSTRRPGIYEAKDGGTSAASWHRLSGCGPDVVPAIPQKAKVWIAESHGRMWLSYHGIVDDDKKVALWRTTPRTCTFPDGFVEHKWEEVTLRDECAQYKNNWGYLFAHPDDPKILFKGGVELCRSRLAGSDLEPVSNMHVDHHTVAVSPTNPSVMYFGTDGGIYRSTDAGVTMQFVGEGLNNTEFYKIDTLGNFPKVVVGGSQDNGTSTWDGLSPIWKYADGTGDSELVAFDRKDPKRIFEIPQRTRQVEVLTPGGDSQALANSTLPDCNGLHASMVSTAREPALGITCKGIWKGPEFVQTIFGLMGPFWHRIQSAPATGDFVQLQASPSGLEWVAATKGGEVYYGSQLKPLLKVFTMRDRGVASGITFVNSKTFYVAANTSSRGFVYRLQCSANCTAESIWKHEPEGDITAISVDPLAPNTLLVAVRALGIFRGVMDTSGKWTWNRYNNGLPFGVTVTDMKPHTRGSVVAGTYGRGAFELFSRIPGPQKLTVTAHVIEFDLDPEPPHTVLASVEIDSPPRLFFTTDKPLQAVLRNAFQNHRLVIIEYVIDGSSNRIVSVRFAQ